MLNFNKFTYNEYKKGYINFFKYILRVLEYVQNVIMEKKCFLGNYYFVELVGKYIEC